MISLEWAIGIFIAGVVTFILVTYMLDSVNRWVR